MDKGKRKPQFQIRRVPLRRNLPEKTPQLNALDVHSICLPSRSKEHIKWGLHTDNHYEQEINPQIIYSPTYQQLYSHYLALREHQSSQRAVLQKEIESIQTSISQEEEKKKRLQSMRDGLYGQVEQLRQNLNQVRDKNYNLRWQIYHQRGAHYMNVNGLSLFQGGEMSYEQLLQMQQQMGNVPRGFTEEQIDWMPTILYEVPEKLEKQSNRSKTNQQICCICFDQLKENDQILSIACKHLHHKECLKDWLLKQRFCPICKQEVRPPPD